jgi:alpha-ketoglutarate-dependent taurine dioxygenase
MLTRNFGEGCGLSWQTVFQTTSKQEVEAVCSRAGIETEWKGGSRLKTRQVRRAVARHPQTSESVWFNHATFFHISTLEPTTREILLSQFSEEDLPYNTYYGDGSPIEASVLDELRAAYRQEAVEFSWQKGDALMIDNMLTAHGRNPYSGPREIIVGMSEPCSRETVQNPRGTGESKHAN